MSKYNSIQLRGPLLGGDIAFWRFGEYGVSFGCERSCCSSMHFKSVCEKNKWLPHVANKQMKRLGKLDQENKVKTLFHVNKRE